MSNQAGFRGASLSATPPAINAEGEADGQGDPFDDPGLNEKRSIDFYRLALGLEVAERLDFETFTLIYLSNEESEFELELTVNKDRSEPYALGDGYGHLALSVDDLDAEHQRAADAGLNPGKIVAFNRDGALLARFFFLVDPDGYKIEVLQRHGRYT